MTEVDWLLDQFARVLEERDAEIAALARSCIRPADAAEGGAGDRRRTTPPATADDEEHPRA